MKAPSVLRVAVFLPLRETLDYLPPAGMSSSDVPVGGRVVVRVGSRRLVGLVCGRGEPRVPVSKLRPVRACLDEHPLIDGHIMALIHFAADYYHHPVGEVVMNALPGMLREGVEAKALGPEVWEVLPGMDSCHAALARAPRQRALLAYLVALGTGRHGVEAVSGFGESWRGLMRQLEIKNIVRSLRQPCLSASGGEGSRPTLNKEQGLVVDSIWPEGTEPVFASHLIEGVTGSGKTEVYLRLIERALACQRQVLVLVPEIGLTPQLLTRFRERFPVPIAALHSGLGDAERRCAWLMSGAGEAPIVIGTRSAVFTPMPRLGLVVVDEEHDGSFKQKENLRYHARDLAIWRGRQQNACVVLGSATPSLETLHHAFQGRYVHHRLLQRAGAAKPPKLKLLDVRHKQFEGGLSGAMLSAVGERIDRKEQVLLFLNRRGYAPVLLCHGCGWLSRCPRCDVAMTFHAQTQRLHCHHCDLEAALPLTCPTCGQIEPKPLGHGTERLEAMLNKRFPGTGILRIDRDTTRRRGALAQQLEAVHSGNYPLLVGTQMLTKGHHFPAVTLVGVIDADQGLYSVDFRAHERLAQLLVQVAGRAGREAHPGEVLIQTCQPEHPFLLTLLGQDYPAAARLMLDERRTTLMPPYSYLALMRAEAYKEPVPAEFLEAAMSVLGSLPVKDVDIMGPVIAPMPRRAGRYRSQLLLRSSNRASLHRLLSLALPRIDVLPESRKVRWSLDVDPTDLY